MSNKDQSIKDDLIDQLNKGANAVAEEPDLKNTEETGNVEDEEIVIDEAQVGKEFREELVCKEDILKVVEYDKEQLDKYAHSRLGKKLDLSKRIKQLRTEVVLLINTKLNLPTDTDSSAVTEKPVTQKRNPEFVFNPQNRSIFEWTEILARRSELIPCYVVDLEGKKL